MEKQIGFQKQACKYCFDNLRYVIKTKSMKSYDEALDQMSFPLFVTWQKNGSLRGCIGTFASN